MKILYYDHFREDNSNFFWKEAFSKYGEVQTVHMPTTDASLNSSAAALEAAIYAFKPTHLHMGGSVKRLQAIPKPALKWLKKHGAKITWFYGDAYNNSVAQSEMLDVVDRLYITNSSHLNHPKVTPVLCPYNPKLYYPFNGKKEHDIIFIGNPHTPERAKYMEELSKKFPIHIYGSGKWRSFKVSYKGALAHRDFSNIIGKYKIALGEPARAPCQFIGPKGGCLKNMPCFKGALCRVSECKEYKGLKMYYSNRLANVMGTGVCHFINYSDGIENILQHEKNIVWYKSDDERDELLKRYLENDIQREAVAQEGLNLIQNYTFERITGRILND